MPVFFFRVIANLPFTSVEVMFATPFSVMVTPIKGTPLLSFTVPVISVFCALALVLVGLFLLALSLFLNFGN